MSDSHKVLRDVASTTREHRYVRPALVELGSVHERTLSPLVGADGAHFTGLFGPFNHSVHCVKRHSQAQVADDGTHHIGFTLPDVV